MIEKRDVKNFQENPILLDWNKTFSDLFPTLSLPLDLSFVRDIQVPDSFFPSEMIRNRLEENFIYFLVQSTLPADSEIDIQKQKAQEIKQLLRLYELSVATFSEKPGFCILKNSSLFSLYLHLNLTEMFPDELIREAEQFSKLLEEIGGKVSSSFSDETQTIKTVKDLIGKSIALTPNEVTSILIEGPIVRNLNHALDTANAEQPQLTDEQVRKFITTNYPIDRINQEIKIGQISGSSNFLYLDTEKMQDHELDEEQYKSQIDKLGVYEVYKRTLLSYVTADRGWISIKLFNLCQSIPEMGEKMLENLDYLDTSWSDTNKVITYSLGLLAHEFIHRLQSQEIMNEYRKIALETWNQNTGTWNGFPSEYVMFYQTEYKAEEATILREDLADSVQIYVINSKYLKTHFLKRFEFIQENFPHLIPDSAQHFIKKVD